MKEVFNFKKELEKAIKEGIVKETKDSLLIPEEWFLQFIPEELRK